MNERASCTNCLHRRPMSPSVPYYSICHYLLDSGERRGSTAEKCTHWCSNGKSTGQERQWAELLKQIRESE